jgi:hypothetical protein
MEATFLFIGTCCNTKKGCEAWNTNKNYPKNFVGVHSVCCRWRVGCRSHWNGQLLEIKWSIKIPHESVPQYVQVWINCHHADSALCTFHIVNQVARWGNRVVLAVNLNHQIRHAWFQVMAVVLLTVAKVICRVIALHAAEFRNLTREPVVVWCGKVNQACSRINDKILSVTGFYVWSAIKQAGEVECPPLLLRGY